MIPCAVAPLVLSLCCAVPSGEFGVVAGVYSSFHCWKALLFASCFLCALSNLIMDLRFMFGII